VRITSFFPCISLTAYADDEAVLAISDRADAAWTSGDLKQAFQLQQSLRDALRELDPGEYQQLISNCEVRMAGLKSILAMPPETIEEISLALKACDDDGGTARMEEMMSFVERLRNSHEAVSRHLPLSSPVRLWIALQYSRHRRLVDDPKDLIELIQRCHVASNQSHGSDFETTIGLAMELAILEISSEKSERACQRMQALLFSVEDGATVSHFRYRQIYAVAFLSALSHTRQFDLVGENARRTIELYSPYSADQSITGNFILSGRICLDAFERIEKWQYAAELCRHMLHHEILHEIGYLEHKQHFLQGRYRALIRLSEHEVAAGVAAELAATRELGALALERHLPHRQSPLESTYVRFAQARAASDRGDFTVALDVLEGYRESLQRWSPEKGETLIDNCEIDIASIKYIIALPAEVVDEVTDVLKRSKAAWAEAEENPSIDRSKVAKWRHEELAKHLPVVSPIRMRAAIVYSRYARLSDDPVNMRSEIQEYRDTSAGEHGQKFHTTINLEIELALIDLIGENSDDAYRQLRHVLFSESPDMRDDYYFSRLDNMNEFLESLYTLNRFDAIHECSQDFLRFYTLRSAIPEQLAQWDSAARIIVDAYERRQKWPHAAEVCRYMLKQEQLKSPEFLQARLHFLERLHYALGQLEEFEELVQVSAELTAARQMDPARRSRYTED